jgi:hypothetical protein
MNRRRSAFWWVAAALTWIGVVAVGLAALMDYDNQPGTLARAPEQWPSDSRITRAVDRPTLVMLAHPRCDCTRASLVELHELLARLPEKPRTVIVFIKPGRTGAEWEQSGLWRQANGIQGITVMRDDLGAEARRFGVETSGQTLLYAPDGHLLFSGGATGARGKVGDNVGRATLLSLLSGASASGSSTPVFGCPLFGPGDVDSHSSEHAHGV